MNTILAEAGVYLGSLFLILAPFVKKPWFISVYLRYAIIVVVFELAMYFFYKQTLTTTILQHQAWKVAVFETIVLIAIAYFFLFAAIQHEQNETIDGDLFAFSRKIVWFLALLQVMNVFFEWRTVWSPIVLSGIVAVFLLMVSALNDKDGFWSGYFIGRGGS